MSRLSRFRIDLLAFFAGLAAVCWIGAAYLGSNPLASGVTLLIGVCYVAGAAELRRSRQATAALARTLAQTASPPPQLDSWLDQVPASLRGAVRMRIDGARGALPGPALTPYLVGMLVLLGMLGTLLGMVVTLRSTGAALASATDLDAIRNALAAPVNGLGFAFGTSIAGVASSAMLGLLSALYRRDRIDTAQLLDQKIATVLRAYSPLHRREAAFALLQQQSSLLPALVEKLDAMTAALGQQHLAINERQLADQQAFHERSEASYARLAASVERALRDSVTEGARAAHAALKPAVQATLGELARAANTVHESVTQATQRQLEALSADAAAQAARITESWERSAAEQQRTQEALVQHQRTTLDQLTHAASTVHESVTQAAQRQLEALSADAAAQAARISESWERSAAEQQRTQEALVQHQRTTLDQLTHAASTVHESVTQAAQRQLDVLSADAAAQAARISESWERSAAEQQRTQEALVQHQRTTLDQLTHAASTVHESVTQAAQRQLDVLSADAAAQAARISESWERSAAEQQRTQEAIVQHQRVTLDQFAALAEQRAAAVLEGMTARLDASAAQQSESWRAALAEQARVGEQLAGANQQALTAAAATFEQQAAKLLQQLSHAHTDLQTALASGDQERLRTWHDTLGSLTANMRDAWEHASEHATQRQQVICDTLARTADELSAQTQAHARDTIAELAQLVQAASAAPQAAASVIAELRQQLSDSMVRDTAMLEERNRLMATLGTLLDAVDHASTRQRAAVDTLLGTSSELLERIGARFGETLERETGKLDAVAAQVAGSALEVASLGDAFGAAVHAFGASNDKLANHLQRIETALGQSLARSDEQLAYYVAQAKEVVDLSLHSHQQIIEELRRVAGHERVANPLETETRERAGAETA